jgi:hypothetical protein
MILWVRFGDAKMRMTSAAIAFCIVGLQRPAHSETVNYPSDVDAFIHRAARCSTATAAKQAPTPPAHCETLAADKIVLTKRYRGNKAILDALNGHWIIVVQRLGPAHSH